MNRRMLLPWAIATGVGLGCAPPGEHAPSGASAVGHHHHGALEFTLDGVRLGAGPVRLDHPGTSIRQLGLRFDARLADGPVEITVRPLVGDVRGAPQTVRITWREGHLGVGRALLDPPADAVELTARGLDGAVVALHPEVVARLDRPLARELPVEGAGGAPKQARGPAGTITREQWGARAPGQLCSPINDPFRMSIHHTAAPADDGFSAPENLGPSINSETPMLRRTTLSCWRISTPTAIRSWRPTRAASVVRTSDAPH